MKKMKLIIAGTFAAIVLLCFSANSQTVIYSVKESLKLCYLSVIPSLLPFFILCNFILKIIKVTCKRPSVTAYFTSLISGFPTGVKNVCALYESGVITRKDAERLLYCTANASPAYIVSFIGGCIIKDRRAGIILLISQFITSFICALIFGVFKKRTVRKASVINLTESACFAVTESVSAILNVCGYIIFFAVIADMVRQVISTKAEAVIIGFIEITRGLSLIGFESRYSIFSVSAIVAFSGISVIMQCVNCTVKAGLSSRTVVKGKLIYTVLMPPITYLLYNYL